MPEPKDPTESGKEAAEDAGKTGDFVVKAMKTFGKAADKVKNTPKSIGREAKGAANKAKKLVGLKEGGTVTSGSLILEGMAKGGFVTRKRQTAKGNARPKKLRGFASGGTLVPAMTKNRDGSGGAWDAMPTSAPVAAPIIAPAPTPAPMPMPPMDLNPVSLETDLRNKGVQPLKGNKPGEGFLTNMKDGGAVSAPVAGTARGSGWSILEGLHEMTAKKKTSAKASKKHR